MLVSRVPFFYGWIIVGVVMLAGAFLTGLTLWGLSIFVVPMETELGWSRSTIFAALAIGAVASSVLGPLIGPLGDKPGGARILFLVGALLLAGSLVYLREVAAPWQYFLFFGVLGGIARFALGMSNNLIAKWFVRKRGAAQAWASAGNGIGIFVFPILIQFMIDAVGWRDAWMYLGVVSFVLLVPAALLLHTAPEHVSLLPDGSDNRSRGTQARRSAADERSFTRREALRTPVFWTVLVALTLANIGMMGLIPNLVPFLRDQGFSATIAATSVTAYAIANTLVRFLWGYLSDRIRIRYLFVAQCLFSALTVLLIYAVANTPMLFAAMGMLGLAFGGFWILQNLIVADYFGRGHLAGIRGLIQPSQNISGWGGPVLLAFIFDSFGTYLWMFVAVLLAWLISAGIAYFARPPYAEAGKADTRADHPASR